MCVCARAVAGLVFSYAVGVFGERRGEGDARVGERGRVIGRIAIDFSGAKDACMALGAG